MVSVGKREKPTSHRKQNFERIRPAAGEQNCLLKLRTHKRTHAPPARRVLKLNFQRSCSSDPNASHGCEPTPPVGGPIWGRRGLRLWAQTLPSTCMPQFGSWAKRDAGSPPGGLITFPTASSPSWPGPTRQAATSPRPGRLGVSTGRPEQADLLQITILVNCGCSARVERQGCCWQGQRRAEENRERPSAKVKFANGATSS